MEPRRRTSRPDVREADALVGDMGVTVTATTVWARGRSRTFTPDEVTTGQAEEWIGEVEKQQDAADGS